MNSFGKHRYIFHISNISIILFLLTQLFSEKENYSTKYNQKKTIISNKLKEIQRKEIKKIGEFIKLNF